MGQRVNSVLRPAVGERVSVIGGRLRKLVTPVRPFLSVLLLLLAAAPVPAAEPIVIGEIDSRTGQFAAQGSAIHQGVALAVEEANGRGGIGRPLALLSRD